MMFNETIECIVKNRAISVLNGNKIEGGHNGPYYDFELPIRNISHWACTFAKYYEITGDHIYIDALKIISDELLQLDTSHPCVCRIKCGKDKTNGVMGQAWVIEGLLACFKSLNDARFYDKSVELFKHQKFNTQYGMWSVVETDGRDMGFDITFNHQLWFAAAGSEILDVKYDKEIDEQIKLFLKKAEKFFYVHKNGLIFHFLRYVHDFRSFRWFYRTLYATENGLKKNIPSLVYKEEGYHLFSIYAFAIMYERYKDEHFFHLDKVRRAIRFSVDADFLRRLSDSNNDLDSTHIRKHTDKNINAYSYPYNSPAFELPFINKVFQLELDGNMMEFVCQEQIRLTYDPEKRMFAKNTEDAETLTARIYEYVRAL